MLGIVSAPARDAVATGEAPTVTCRGADGPEGVGSQSPGANDGQAEGVASAVVERGTARG